MQKRKSFFNNEMKQRFSLRKYTIGLCSVCLGFVTIGMGSQSVKADTVSNVEKSSIVQENKTQDTDPENTDALAESKTNISDSTVTKSNTTPTETKENEAGSVAMTAPKTSSTSTGTNTNEATPTETKLDKIGSTVANSNNASAQTESVKKESVVQPKVSGTSTETKLNESNSGAINPNVVSTEVKPSTADPASLAKIKPQKFRLAKLIDIKALAESKVTTDNQFNFDNWTTEIDDNCLDIIGYKGDRSKQIVIPNGADFAKAGKNDKGLQVGIGGYLLADLIVDGVAPKLSNTDNQKIIAKGYWSGVFSDKHLHDISGLANLDTSNIINMSDMFANNQISDLSPLANWDTSKVTNMNNMFANNQISDLSPLINWNTDKVTNMGSMFKENQISNLSPLAGWNTDNVTYMSEMFSNNQISALNPLINWHTNNVTNMDNMFDTNQISDLSSLANWSTDNVTNMSSMFSYNQISDLKPLANWHTNNVTNMSSMFDGNQISDLSPLADWNTGKVTNMSSMFDSNRISDLSPLTNWNTGKVIDMSRMFYRNRISDLSPLTNWKVDKVTDMSGMFNTDQISDLSPLSNWNTGNVTNMYAMFAGNSISDLRPLANWDTGNVTDMAYMFNENKISDLSPLSNWNTGNVTDMGFMFEYNQISSLKPLANWNTGNVVNTGLMFDNNQISDLSPLANWNISKVINMMGTFARNPLDSMINSQSTLDKFHVIAYKLDNTDILDSHNESKTFNDGSQILLDKNVVINGKSATLTFKANSSIGRTYQIKIYNPNDSVYIQAAPLPTALGTTDISYQDNYTIITNKFINNGSVSQDISIDRGFNPFEKPSFAQYESTSGQITVVKDDQDLGSINITYQNPTDISNWISTPHIGNKPYINHTQNVFYFEPEIDSEDSNQQYSFIKSAGLTITVPDDVTIDPDTFIDEENGKTLKATKIGDNKYYVVLNNTTDEIAVKGLIDVPTDKLTNGTTQLPGFGINYTINTYNDKIAPLVVNRISDGLSIISDLASYHGDLINISQSKWAFNRNGNHVYDYTSQGFTNEFNGAPFEPAVITKITNGVETFDMPTGVNITDFNPQFNRDAIDHIDYIYTDGSKQKSLFIINTPKAIRQMKVYFKNGIQSDQLAKRDYDFALSFDDTYPDGTPIKNFDTFKITGSFSCDELGSTGNVDVTQIMLASTQRLALTDGMLTNTSQSESNKAPNANDNSISAIISNDGLQHQGHLINPIFYFKYNSLMVPNLSEISVSYSNQNKELGLIGSTNIDNSKIHSSIITDNAGQRFIKVRVDGEYYYGSSDFNVRIPINNTPDALAATKDWSWYILNNSDEEKTKSIIRNPSSSLYPVTVDGNTLSVGGSGTWQIIVAQGFASGTETQGNLNGGPGLASTQDDHQQDPTRFNIYDSIINATNDAKSDLVSVTNLPSTQDGKSQFDVHMTGKASLINTMTGQTHDATITYSYGTGDNNFITSDQVKDWSLVKSIKVVPNGGAPSMTSLRLVVPVEDKTIYNDVGKTIYMSTMTYGEDKTNTNYTTEDGFAVPEKSTILPIIIKPGDAASATLTVRGQATVHTLIHYKDTNGKDVYVKLADQDKTYNELQDTMKRSDYLQSDRDLTIADRGLLPAGMVIDYKNPTIRNSTNTYVAGYANNTAEFDKTAKYDFDGDQVIFKGAMPEIVTKTHQAKETIHYVYRDGSTAKPDKVLTSITLKQIGHKNPFTGEITWDSPATDTLNSVDSPEITGYIADQSIVPSYMVTVDSPDKEVTVTYDADNENADFTYFDDTTNSPLKVVNKSGKSNTSIGYNTTDEINNYEKQGYTLVSDDTNGRTLNFNSLPTVDQHYTIHLKHASEEITKDHIPSGAKDKDDKHAITDKDFSHDVTRTITINTPSGNVTVDDQGHQTVASTPQDASQTTTLTRTGKYDKVTGEVTWNPWQSGHFDAVDVPVVNGYTPSQSTIGAVENVGADYNDPKINITYTAKGASQKIHYVDENGNGLVDPKDASGNDVKDGTATGVTDEIVNVPIPDGWDLVDSSDSTTKLVNPDTTSNVATKTVKIKHGTVVVDHTNPHNNGDLVDTNKPEGTRYNGVTDQDLNQDAIRKFIFYLPANTNAENYAHTFMQTVQTKVIFDANANTVTITQTVDFYRDAIVDKITGKVVGYKAKNGTIIKLDAEHDHGWIPSDASNGRFEAITFKQIKGYTPNVKATASKKSVNMMVRPALFRTAMLYNISFFANATFEKPKEKEISKKAGNQDVIPSNKTTGKNTEPAKYVPKDPIQNGKDDPVKIIDSKGATSDLTQKPETKSDGKNKGNDDNTNPVIPSGSTPSTPVNNTPKRDTTQKQETKQNTDEQKTVVDTQKVSTKKTVKKHAKKSVKKGVKKTPAKKAPTSATVPVAPTEKRAPVSDAKVHKVVSTTTTVNAQETKNGEKELPQTGNKTNYALITLGLASAITSLSLIGAKKRKRS